MASNVKIYDTLEYRGQWWTIGEEDKKVSGVLRYSKENQIKLEISGDYSNESSLMKGLSKGDLPIVLGDCFEGHITLCLCAGASMGARHAYGENSKKKVTMIFEYIIIGQHFHSISDIKFPSLIAEFSTLKYWIDHAPFKIDIFGEVSLREEKVRRLFSRIEEYKMTLSTGYSVQEVSENNETVGVKYGFGLVIEPDEEQSIEWYIKIISKFKHFLSIYTDTPTFVLSMEGMIGDKSNPNSVSVCEIPWYDYKEIPRIDNFGHFIISIYNMFDNIDEILNKWYSLNHDEILYTYISNISQDNRTIQEKFLGYARVIESLHRFQDDPSLKTTLIDPIRYGEIVSKLMVILKEEKDVDNNLYNKINDNLKHANEHGFQRRIKEVLRSLPEEIAKIICYGMKHAEYADIVRENRDYYTHFFKRPEGLLNDYEMMAMNFSLKVISLWMISRKIGISEETLEHVLSHRGRWLDILKQYEERHFKKKIKPLK